MKHLISLTAIIFCTNSVLLSQSAKSQDLQATPKIKWQFATKGEVVSSVVISGSLALVGSNDRFFYALDKNTGKEMWKVETGGAVSSTAAISSGKAFFTSSDGLLYAVDLSNGKVVWKFKTSGEKQYDLWDYFLSSPVVAGDKIIFGSGDGKVYAVNESTGRQVWAFQTNGIVHATPAISDNAIFIGGFDGFFYAINMDGTLRWKFDTIGETTFPKGEVQYRAVVEDSTVYFTSRDFNIYALNTESGKGRWVYHEVGSWAMAPTLAGKQLIVGTSDTHRFVALSKATGRPLWEVDTRLNAYGALTANDSVGYAGSSDGRLMQISLKNGKAKYTFQTNASKQYYPDFFDANNQVRLMDLLKKYDNDISKIYKAVFMLGSILSTPTLEVGTLYFGSTDNSVYALN